MREGFAVKYLVTSGRQLKPCSRWLNHHGNPVDIGGAWYTRTHNTQTPLSHNASRLSSESLGWSGNALPPHQHSQACQLQQHSLLPFVANKHLFIRFLACIRKCLNWIIRNRLRFINKQIIRWCERNECPNKLFNPLKITCYIICTCISEIINCFGWNYCQLR